MTGRRALATVVASALLGAVATLAAGRLSGMQTEELRHLAWLLGVAVAVTTAATALVTPLLARASIRRRFVAVATLAGLGSLLNLAVLVRTMAVSGEDATLIVVLLLYSAGAGIGAGLALARSSGAAVGRLVETARSLADGDLGARTGRLEAGPELDALAGTLDEMAERLQTTIARERAGEAKRRDLITAVSHDLRTPLASLQAMVEAVDEGVVDDPTTLRRYITEIRRSVGSLSLLIDDLFELVQLDAGVVEAESERARLEDVFGAALAICQAQAREKGLVLQASLDGAGDFRCSPRLVRVVQNLLQNAIRHTPADGTVSVTARREADAVRLVVEDTGEGIDEQQLGRVFDPFWRGDASRAGSGSGLGLALAKRIVEALGGEIEVRSTRDAGSAFSVVLPPRPADEGAI